MVDRGGNRIDQAPATDDEYASGGAYYDHFDSGERKGLILETIPAKIRLPLRFGMLPKGILEPSTSISMIPKPRASSHLRRPATGI